LAEKINNPEIGHRDVRRRISRSKKVESIKWVKGAKSERSNYGSRRNAKNYKVDGGGGDLGNGQKKDLAYGHNAGGRPGFGKKTRLAVKNVTGTNLTWVRGQGWFTKKRTAVR